MLKFIRRLLIAILVVAIAGYFGAKYYFENQAERALREFAYVAEDTLRFDYETLAVGLGGTLTLENVNLRPGGVGGGAFVGRMILEADSVGGLMRARDALAAGRLPDGVTLSLEELRLKVDDPTFRRLAELTGNSIYGLPFDHLGCGDIERVDGDVLVDMGYEQLAGEAQISSQLDADGRRALLSARVDMNNVTAWRAEGLLSGGKEALTLDMLADAQAALVEGDLRYRDQGFFEARNYYCAAQTDVELETFIDGHVDATRRYLRAYGAVPTDAFVASYRRLVANPGGELSMALRPAQPKPIAELVSLEAEPFFNQWQPQFAINGEPIEQAVTRWVRPAIPRDKDPEKAGTGPERSYYAADPAKLAELAGSFARISTYDGTVQKGTIQEANAESVVLARRYRGGGMSFRVAVGNIKKAEIFRDGPLPADLRPPPAEPEPAEDQAPAEGTGEEPPADEATQAPERSADTAAGDAAGEPSPDSGDGEADSAQ